MANPRKKKILDVAANHEVVAAGNDAPVTANLAPTAPPEHAPLLTSAEIEEAHSEVAALFEKRSKQGLSNRARGKTFERECATSLRSVFGDTVRRGLQSRDGADAPDVLIPVEAGLWVECKYSPTASVAAALIQATLAEHAHRGLHPEAPKRAPVVIVDKPHKGPPGSRALPPVVGMYLPDYLRVLAAGWRPPGSVMDDDFNVLPPPTPTVAEIGPLMLQKLCDRALREPLPATKRAKMEALALAMLALAQSGDD
jgi:hypothetical protein